MKVYEGIQYDAEYWQLRRGKPTASEMGNIITPRTMKPAAAADSYIARLIADLYDPFYPRLNEYATPAMQHGTQQEPESRRWYCMELATDIQQVKFCISDCGRYGASPDGLTSDGGVLECKNPQPATMVKWLLEGAVPDDHRGQVEGLLVVTGCAYVDWLAYCPPLPPLLIRVVPNAFTAALKKELDLFHARYVIALAKIRGMEPKTEAA